MDKMGDLPTASTTLFPLRVLWARLPAYLNHPLVTLERLTLLIVDCKKQGWTVREQQVTLVLATHMMAMGDFVAAAITLERIPRNADVLSSLARLYLQLGDIHTAESLYGQIEGSGAAVQEAIKVNK